MRSGGPTLDHLADRGRGDADVAFVQGRFRFREILISRLQAGCPNNGGFHGSFTLSVICTYIRAVEAIARRGAQHRQCHESPAA
jgi:hypothetical protein